MIVKQIIKKITRCGDCPHFADTQEHKTLKYFSVCKLGNFLIDINFQKEIDERCPLDDYNEK